MRISDWSSDVCSSDLCRLYRWASRLERQWQFQQCDAGAQRRRCDRLAEQYQYPAGAEEEPGRGGRHFRRQGFQLCRCLQSGTAAVSHARYRRPATLSRAAPPASGTGGCPGADRKSAVEGKSVAVRVGIGGRLFIKKKKNKVLKHKK